MPIAEVELVNFAVLIPTNRVQGKLDAYHVLEPLLVASVYGSAVPEFPSMFLPATMIIGIFGAMLLIQRTREH